MGDEIEFYQSIGAEVTEVMYNVKGSKFISYAYPVTNKSEISEILDKLRKEHFKANHCCYAWSLGWHQPEFRYNDDGEPANTAGKPIYGQLLSHELTQILVVVVRYFGGTRLGVGGLIQAYRESARLALDQAKVSRHEIVEVYRLSFKYPELSRVMRLVRELGLHITSQEMTMEVELILEVPKNKREQFLSQTEQLRMIHCRRLS
jgi:uncharacterized YigZ family protein